MFKVSMNIFSAHWRIRTRENTWDHRRGIKQLTHTCLDHVKSFPELRTLNTTRLRNVLSKLNPRSPIQRKSNKGLKTQQSEKAPVRPPSRHALQALATTPPGERPARACAPPLPGSVACTLHAGSCRLPIRARGPSSALSMRLLASVRAAPTRGARVSLSQRLRRLRR